MMFIRMSTLRALLTACQVGFSSYGVGDGKYAATSELTVPPDPGASWCALNVVLGKFSYASLYSGSSM